MERPIYKYQARNIDAFVSQVVRLAASGYQFAIRVRIPDKKDPQTVVEKVLDLYSIKQPRWRRERRRLKRSAGVHLIWYDRLFVIMLTKGRHDELYTDHGTNMLNLKRSSLHAFGYSIKVDGRTGRVNVRLDNATYRRLKAHMLAVCTWASYRDKERMEREFVRLRFQVYEPVHDQLIAIGRAVNRARKRRGRGFPLIDLACIPRWVRPTKVFVERGDLPDPSRAATSFENRSIGLSDTQNLRKEAHVVR